MKSNDTQQSFRDRLYTIDENGKRLWVFAKKPKGALTSWRNITGIILLAFFFTAPFIKVKGEQFLLFDFMNRKFVIFGARFWPQDFNLFFIAMIALIVFIILFTATYGRIWCGWACPQTVFMEVLFRRVEYLIDGDIQKQKELDAMPWNLTKIFKLSLKHLVFYIMSFAIGNLFLVYIIGSDAWFWLITDKPSGHIAGLTIMIIFSFVFYFIFSWFREQVCTIVCPYGRLQGVLLDPSTVVISYDYKRGEERGSLRKSENRREAGKGDCIDCRQCVMVCPTGIDIRNGTQLECINCACCIDACNDMMRKTGFKTGLIRYSSEKMIAEGKPWRLTLRSAGYSVVLAALLAVFAYFLVGRNPVEATVMRSPGTLFQDMGEGKIANLYDIKIVNKTTNDLPVEVNILSRNGEVKIIGKDPVIKRQTVGEAVFFIILDRKDIPQGKMELNVGVFSGGKLLDETKATFFGPEKKNK
ncbi:MAG: cytochrome c oxidase accessory protein CcoG [Bacteroidetes bacterium]|nr:cytochrome c oxidase accessory protein CcoG [Bacteroidota bacterium]